jgi:hypothetical protein
MKRLYEAKLRSGLRNAYRDRHTHENSGALSFHHRDVDGDYRMKMRDDFRRSGVSRRVAVLALMALLGCTIPPAPPTEGTLPETLRTPVSTVLDATLIATGDSVFQCRRVSAGLQWRYQGSQATLADKEGDDVGTVTPGGYLVAYDGSYVILRVVAQEPVAQNSMPWALLTSRFNAPSPTEPPGLFSKTMYAQRVSTKGGLPAVPDCTIEGTNQYIHYTATYRLYRLPTDTAPAVPSSPASGDDVGTPATPPGIASDSAAPMH